MIVVKRCPNCGTDVQSEWIVCPVCTMNLKEAANLLGREDYVPPPADITSGTKLFADSPPATFGQYIRAIWVIIVGGIGLGYIFVAFAQLLGLLSDPFGLTGVIGYTIVGFIIGKVGSLPFEGIKNEPLRMATSLLALVCAVLMVKSNVDMFGV